MTASRPAGGDDDPAGVLALRSPEHDVGDDAVAEEDEQHGPDEFGEEWGHGEEILILNKIKGQRSEVKGQRSEVRSAADAALHSAERDLLGHNTWRPI